MGKDEIDSIVEQRMEQRQRPRPSKVMLLRQVLNIIFMAMALAGVVCILVGKNTVGMYIVMVAIVVKFAEAALRIMRL